MEVAVSASRHSPRENPTQYVPYVLAWNYRTERYLTRYVGVRNGVFLGRSTSVNIITKRTAIKFDAASSNPAIQRIIGNTAPLIYWFFHSDGRVRAPDIHAERLWQTRRRERSGTWEKRVKRRTIVGISFLGRQRQEERRKTVRAKESSSRVER